MIRTFLKNLRTVKQNRVISRYYDLVNFFSSLSPKLIHDLPHGENVLVVAPHCDDESLGCGGTLYKHHCSGHRITAVFMTDGAQCETEKEAQEIIKIRKTEAEQAAKILGINQCIFLDHPDRHLKTTEPVIQQMIGILEKVNPDIAYVPFYMDNHSDHMETARICLSALRRRPVKTVLFYELWTTLVPNCLVDISDALGKKMDAIRVYRSQKDIDGFAEIIKSLNHYRSLGSNGSYQHAEAFMEINQEIMGKILDS